MAKYGKIVGESQGIWLGPTSWWFGDVLGGWMPLTDVGRYHPSARNTKRIYADKHGGLAPQSHTVR